MKLILASKNPHKAAEMQAILGESVELITQDAAGFGDLDVIEDGSTFEENALKKAVTIMEASGAPAIADDSGLSVDALQGRPGIFTARFAGENATDDENINKLLDELKNVPEAERTARFVCVIALAIPGEEPKTFRGEAEGRILFEKHGENGFGYDPVFYLPQFDSSMAEIAADVKNSVSHRFNALKLLKEYLG
ncbi:MAG: XTP/dITP diphosphatase [Ruminococcaceae bacterium]|nr:XTP/dITP diphosphatase [Oscillospiraceae bacterium]